MSFKLTCDLNLNQYSNQQLINLQNQLTRVITKRLIKQEPEPVKVTVNLSIKRTDHLANREKRLHDALVNRQKRLANREKRLASPRESNNGSPSPRRNNGSPSPRRNNGSPSPRDLSPPRRQATDSPRDLSHEAPRDLSHEAPRDMFRTKCANATQMKRKIRFRTDSDSDSVPRDLSHEDPQPPRLDFKDGQSDSDSDYEAPRDLSHGAPPQLDFENRRSYVDRTLDEIIAETQDLFESESESESDDRQPQPTKQQLDQELDEIVRQRENYYDCSEVI